MSNCECERPQGQCVKGDLDRCPVWDEEEADDDYDEGVDCGRWDQNAKGGMSSQCRLAGTEFCDFGCPYSR